MSSLWPGKEDMRGLLGGSGKNFPAKGTPCAQFLRVEGTRHVAEAERRPERLGSR